MCSCIGNPILGNAVTLGNLCEVFYVCYIYFLERCERGFCVFLAGWVGGLAA
jgi:hypothetical protein